MILTLDAGNSSLKYGIFEKGVLRQSDKLDYKDQNFWSKLQSLYDSRALQKIIYSSVKGEEWNTLLQDSTEKPISKITSQSKFSFSVNYETPNTLGIDRLTACEGAIQLNHGNPGVVVIDCGTCITYDFVDFEGNYQGGAISPGLQMRAQAMHNYTDRLPLVDLNNKDVGLIGKNTNDCMKSGILNGALFEMAAFIHSFKKANANYQYFLTGGDSIFFANGLKNGIFAEPNLNLIGLNHLAEQK